MARYATALLASLFLFAPSHALPGPVLAPRPLVLWHGLGDSHSSPGMLEFVELIKETHPGIFVHSVYIEQELDKDQRAGWFGNVDEQLAFVAEELAGIPELSGGFDGLGFSQGGQFLRGYVERYNSPPMNNLITFGSQHMGVSDLPLCRPGDWTCQLARRAARSGVYGKWAQENLVQAQYFRDPARLDQYLNAGSFLADINGEIEETRNTTYKDNFASLGNFAMALFTEDKTVVPKESSWFASEAPPEDDSRVATDSTLTYEESLAFEEDAPLPVDSVQMVLEERWPGQVPEKTIIPMRLQRLYVEDWIGLRTLDERGAVHLETCEGAHMQVTKECWEPLVKKFCGEMVVPPVI